MANRTWTGLLSFAALLTVALSMALMSSQAEAAQPTPPTAEAYQSVYTSVSPDGEWIAQGVVMFHAREAAYQTRLKVWKADGTAEWTVADERWDLGQDYAVPRPLDWSPDGRYLYYSQVPEPGECAGFVNGRDLQRVDLTDGSVTGIAPQVGTWLTLSPDGRQLAAYGTGLVVRDLATGEETEVPLRSTSDAGEASVGHIVWSPDGTSLLLTVSVDPCGTAEWQRHSVVRVDLPTGAERVLIDRDDRGLVSATWPEADRATLRDRKGRSWRLDPDTGALVRAGDLDLAVPAMCSTGGADTYGYYNAMDGYCVRYPAQFMVGHACSRTTNLYGPSTEGAVGPIRASVAVRVSGPVGPQGLFQATDEWLSRNQVPTPTVRRVSVLGGELAEYVEYEGEATSGRLMFALHDNKLYVLSFSPIGERLPEIASDAETAWTELTRSFTFLSPYALETYSHLCPEGELLTPYVNAPDGYCFRYPSCYAVTAAAPGRLLLQSSEADWTPADELAIIESLTVDAPAGRTLQEIVDAEVEGSAGAPITRTAVTLGGEPAEAVEGLPGEAPSVQGYALYDGRAHHTTIAPVGTGYPLAAPIAEAAWESLLDSFAYLDALDTSTTEVVDAESCFAVDAPGSWMARVSADGRVRFRATEVPLLSISSVGLDLGPTPRNTLGRLLEGILSTPVRGIEDVSVDGRHALWVTLEPGGLFRYVVVVAAPDCGGGSHTLLISTQQDDEQRFQTRLGFVRFVSDPAGSGAIGGPAAQARIPERGKLVYVDLAELTMYVYENGVKVRTVPVSAPALARFSGKVGADLGPGQVSGGKTVDYRWYLYRGTSGNVTLHSVPYVVQDGMRVYDQPEALGMHRVARDGIRISPDDAAWLAAWGVEGVPVEVAGE